MQKPPCEPSFSKLLYEAIYNYIQHHYIQLVYTALSFPYKESDLIWAFFSTLFALKMCSTVAWLTELLNSLKLKDISGGVWFEAHNNWPISALKLFNSSSFKSICFCFDLSLVISFFFISSINLVWLRLISYLLFWIISNPKYLNILTFSVPTENNTFRSGSITICWKFSVPPQQKSSACVINKPRNSFLKCQKNNADSKLLYLTLGLSNSSLTRKYQFLEACDKPYIQVFNF